MTAPLADLHRWSLVLCRGRFLPKGGARLTNREVDALAEIELGGTAGAHALARRFLADRVAALRTRAWRMAASLLNTDRRP